MRAALDLGQIVGVFLNNRVRGAVEGRPESGPANGRLFEEKV